MNRGAESYIQAPERWVECEVELEDEVEKWHGCARLPPLPFNQMLSNRITIQIETELVTFSKGSQSVRFVPCLYLDGHSVVLSVGEPPLSGGDSVRVDLFQNPRLSLNYDDVLAAFLCHGIRSVSGGGLFQFRPSIEFRISPNIAAFLQGFHRSVFRHASVVAGAVADRITFEES